MGMVQVETTREEGLAVMGVAEPLAFKVGQGVVYPLQGVGRIRNIEERSFKGKKIRYYVIYIDRVDMTILVPVEQSGESRIRAIVSKEECEKALELVGKEHDPIPSDWKLRYQINFDLLKKGDLLDVAVVVRTLYFRSKTKELPTLERKLFDSALNLFTNEVAYATEQSQDDVERLIFSRLESDV